MLIDVGTGAPSGSRRGSIGGKGSIGSKGTVTVDEGAGLGARLDGVGGMEAAQVPQHDGEGEIARSAEGLRHAGVLPRQALLRLDRPREGGDHIFVARTHGACGRGEHAAPGSTRGMGDEASS